MENPKGIGYLPILSMTEPVDYDQVAPTYDQRYEGDLYPGVERTLLDFVGQDLSRQALEAGCGTGHWLALLDGCGFSVTASTLPERCWPGPPRSKAPGATWQRGRAEAIPWPDGSFDRVFVINALDHFERWERFVSEARRVLRTGGGLLIVGRDPHAGLDRWYCYDYFPGNLALDQDRYPTRPGIRDAMRASGLSRCHAAEAQRLRRRIPAREAIETGQIDRHQTSKLARLTDREYTDGIGRIRQELEAFEEPGEPLQLVTDLTLFATTGWAEGPAANPCRDPSP